VFVELDIKRAEGLVLQAEAAAHAQGSEPPRYLLRYGPSLAQATVYSHDRGVEFYMNGQGRIALKRLHQIWRIDRVPT
jgi:hypothetical protein